ncbi:MAG: DUF2207 domain-containing protein [Nitrincola lacisaponensis]|uniref:DUF2207 domain-containing protein n=1 Tax=Nitrincola lacisaponensis TaxID=267850 RepID=UPI00391A5192
MKNSLGYSIIVLFLMFFPGALLAEERILNFHSDILVNSDGSLLITETIHVLARGNNIRRGIYRRIPVVYDSKGVFIVRTPLSLKSVTRNGEPEPFRSYRSDNFRIEIGTDELIPVGEHIYSITYHTERQIGLYSDYDELYWNVTGNGWGFRIDRASAHITFPDTVSADTLGYQFYTGASGSTDQHVTYHQGTNSLYVETTQPLLRNQGLTFAVSWPKGHIQEPTQWEKVYWFVYDNISIVMLSVILFTMLVYYFVLQSIVCPYAKPGIISPQYKPPVGYSASAIRYIINKSIDNKIFVAALSSIAVKGFLTIKPRGDTFILQRTDKEDEGDLAGNEKVVLGTLFSSNKKSIELDRRNRESVLSAINANRKYLVSHYKDGFFVSNRKWFVIGWFFSIFMLFVSIYVSESYVIFSSLVMCLICYFLIGLFAHIFHKGSSYFFHFLKYIVPFLSALDGGFNDLNFNVLFIILLILLIFSVNTFFGYRLKTPTKKGRELLDYVEGMKLFLTVPDLHAWAFSQGRTINLPHKTPEVFDSLFPYALALNLEKQCLSQFSSMFADININTRSKHFNHMWRNRRVFCSSNFSSKMTENVRKSSYIPAPRSRSSRSSFSSSRSGGSSGGGRGGGGGGGR